MKIQATWQPYTEHGELSTRSIFPTRFLLSLKYAKNLLLTETMSEMHLRDLCKWKVFPKKIVTLHLKISKKLPNITASMSRKTTGETLLNRFLLKTLAHSQVENMHAVHYVSLWSLVTEKWLHVLHLP